MGMRPNRTAVAVQGFGNVGSYFSLFASQAGYKIVAVTDSSGGVLKKGGLNIEEVISHKTAGRKLVDYKETGTARITNEEVLVQEVDILAPAALEDQITKENVRKVAAKAVLELANGPVGREGEAPLLEKGVLVVPDILANAGGVVGSYLEWSQNLSGYLLDKEDSLGRIRKMIKFSFGKVWKTKEEREISLRVAAFVEAVRQVEGAMRSRGWFF
jgi:glutamate dehydrogenase/leucine dehydrogenase